MSKTIERVAEALKQAVLAKAGKPYLSIPEEAWRAGVVAVLEGVREPTRDMIRAGAKPYSQEGSVRAAYEAAIDAMIDHLIREASAD